MMRIEEKISNAINSVIRTEKDFIPLHEPSFIGNEWEYVKECIDTSWVSSVGKYVDLFEDKLANIVGVKRAIAVVNGTAALHIALKAAGIVEQDEVLVPTLTFVATANAVKYCNAIPHFVDVEKTTLGIDPYKLSDYLKDITEIKSGQCINKHTGRRIKAVVAMHTFGHPVNLDKLMDVCNYYRIELVEDVAESLGSYYKGKHTGSFSKVSAMSFNGNKIITTGGGGAIFTDDEKLGDYIKHITTTAKVPHKWEYFHDEIGYNYRLPNINAALGCAQLEQLPNFLESKRKLADKYLHAFDNIDEVTFFTEPEGTKSNYWLNTIILKEKNKELLEKILSYLNKEGIMSRPAWRVMHQLSIYQDSPKMNTEVAEDLQDRIINIPSSSGL